MVTIRDVAKYAGVSVATVSRTINNKGYVSEETKKKVIKVIEELNYRPNNVARSLYKKDSKMIGLIVPDIINPFFPELARGVEDAANNYGYTLVLCNSDDDLKKEKEYIDSLMQKQVDGLIITNANSYGVDYKKLGVPIVALDRKLDNEIPAVVSDNYGGGKMATEYLIKKGCKNIMHIKGPKNLFTAEERYRGFLDVVKENDIEYKVIESNYDFKKSHQVAIDIFGSKSNIDGIFAGNDVIATSVISVAKEKKVVIPDEVQVIGFDGIMIGNLITPRITTVRQSIYEMGKLSMQILLDQINNKKLEKHLFCLPVEIEERDTTI